MRHRAEEAIGRRDPAMQASRRSRIILLTKHLYMNELERGARGPKDPFAKRGVVVLALILALFAGRSYSWRPDIDVTNSFVFSTLFADGGH
jgi:hypothetical protein